MSYLSDIEEQMNTMKKTIEEIGEKEEQMNTMKKTIEEIGEKIILEKEKSIQNFLQALVQCGEISQEKRESIERNVCLTGFFMKLDEYTDDDVEEF
jgi:predicted transcriptional regulator